MRPKQIRVLLLEPTTQKENSLEKYLRADPIMDVVGRLGSVELCQQDREQMEQLNPDVIVVDIMDQNYDLEQLLRVLPKLTSGKLIGIFTPNSAEKVFAGRLYSFVERSWDCVGQNLETVYERLKYQIKNARLTAMTEQYGLKGKWVTLPVLPLRKLENEVVASDYDLIAIGASAGGTEAIMSILAALPLGMPPIMVVQHMPREFVAMLSRSLSEKCRLEVRLTSGGEKLLPGVIYLTEEDRHLTVRRDGNNCVIQCVDAEKVQGHRPSVDMLFSSAALALGPRAMGVILTGMGTDGAKGLLQMHDAGAYTIGQDEQSSAVYGMPAAAYKLGAVSRQLSLGQIAEELVLKARRQTREVKA